MQQKIFTIYRKDGTVERHVVNAPGGQCEQLTRAYREDDAKHGEISVTPTADGLMCQQEEVTETEQLMVG